MCQISLIYQLDKEIYTQIRTEKKFTGVFILFNLFWKFFLSIILTLITYKRDMQIQKDHRTHQNILISSLTSCIISTIATNPIQVAKLKVQYAPTLYTANYSHLTNTQKLIKINQISFTFRDAFKGLSIIIPQALLSNAIFMQLYEYQRNIYIDHLGSTPGTILASMLSRLFASTVINPIQAFRVRKVNSNLNEKIHTSQRGLKITLVRDLVFNMLYWPIVQGSRNYFSGKEYRGSNRDGALDANAIAGIIGGSIVAVIATPFDTIKTRIQSGIKLEGSIKNQLKTIYYKQGLIGLFSGVHFRAIRCGMNSAIYLIIYESVMSSLRKSNNNKNYVE